MILTVEGLETYIGEFHILQGVSLQVPTGTVTVLLGRNGAGKTTTLRSIMGFLKPRRGKIEFEGVPINGLAAHMVARKGIGYVPEDQAIFSGLTVEENLRIAMRGKNGDNLLDKVFSLFPDLKVAWRKKAGSLSGGQKQMLAMGRGLVTNSRLLLIDEPSKGLAPVVIEKLAEAIKEIKKDTTVVLVEQNFNLARAVGDRYYLIDDGHTVLNGAMEELVANTALQQRYLGISLVQH